jgi:hypothetical protein
VGLLTHATFEPVTLNDRFPPLLAQFAHGLGRPLVAHSGPKPLVYEFTPYYSRQVIASVRSGC